MGVFNHFRPQDPTRGCHECFCRIVRRAALGKVHVRLGGNAVEFASLLAGGARGLSVSKRKAITGLVEGGSWASYSGELGLLPSISRSHLELLDGIHTVAFSIFAGGAEQLYFQPMIAFGPSSDV